MINCAVGLNTQNFQRSDATLFIYLKTQGLHMIYLSWQESAD